MARRIATGMMLLCFLTSYTQSLTAPNIFLDCKTNCYFTHIRTELSYVNFVRDRQQADVFLLLTSLRTGSGGEEYTLESTGYNAFADQTDTLTFYIDAVSTDGEIQDIISRNIESILIPYLLKTDLRSLLTVRREELPETAVVSPEYDPWRSWLFEFGGNFWYSAVEAVEDISVSGRMNISKVTDAHKFNTRVSYNFNESKFKLEEDSVFVSVQRSMYTSILYVKSITDHLSVGGRFNVWNNTFSNYELGVSLRPAVEYNLYPYQEATRNQFTFQYSIGPSYNDYVDSTIFNLEEEWLWSHDIEIDYIMLEDWGTVRIGLDYANYLHDWSLLSLSFRPRVSWNITRGLNFNVSAEVSLFRNQRNIVKENISTEEQLLRIKQLGSNYEYSFGVGLSYRFGSTYNNVVNTRF